MEPAATQQRKASTSLVPNKTILKNRWRILFKLGEGAFGETYVAHDATLGNQVAVKFESPTCHKPVLRLESHVLKCLQESPYVCRYLGCGKTLDDLSYLVMELQGQNLSILRKQMKDQKLTLATTSLLGIHMINAIESIHERGFLHRDVKPANFVLSLKKDGYDGRRKCFIIDFGLSRQFTTDKGTIRPPRNRVGFRGTARYASLHSHRCEELGRRDDIWSLFYILVEFAMGKLPWSREKEKQIIAIQKEKWMDYALVADLPSSFRLFFDHVRKLEYLDRPDYTYLRTILLDMFESLGEARNVPYDWETPAHRARVSLSVVNSTVNSRVEDIVEERNVCLSDDSKATLTDSDLLVKGGNRITPLDQLMKIRRHRNKEVEVPYMMIPQQDEIPKDVNVADGSNVASSSRTLTASIELRQFRLEGLSSYGADHEGESDYMIPDEYPMNQQTLLNSILDKQLPNFQLSSLH